MLSHEEMSRYSRQMMLPEIGPRGQERLKKATVLVAGAGGLGSVSLMYLAAAGVGTLRVVDGDTVGLSNLNRQIIHSSSGLGRTKIESARERILALNPNVTVSLVEGRIDTDTGDALVRGVDIIVDALDNLESRRLLNRMSVRHGLPFVFGGVSGFEGMASTFVPGKTPCLECLFPERDPGRPIEKKIIGVVGPVPGIIASIQCLEVIGLILNRKISLAGVLARFRGLDMTLRKVHIQQDPMCPVCGT